MCTSARTLSQVEKKSYFVKKNDSLERRMELAISSAFVGILPCKALSAADFATAEAEAHGCEVNISLTVTSRSPRATDSPLKLRPCWRLSRESLV